MKHAFIFATNIYISNHKTVSYNGGGPTVTFLTVHTFYNQGNNKANVLTVDAEIYTIDDHHPVKIVNNVISEGADVQATIEPNRIRIYHRSNAEPILDIYQLQTQEYEGLSSHILNEINAQLPDHVVSIKGNFKVAGAHIYIENEKMQIENDTYANGVENAHNGVILSSSDIVHLH